MQLFLALYCLFHITTLDRNRNYSLREDATVLKLEKEIDSWISARIASANQRLLWLFIALRWIYAAATILSMVAVSSSFRFRNFELAHNTQPAVVIALAAWTPVLGIFLPSVMWVITKAIAINLSRCLVDAEGKDYSEIKRRMAFVLLKSALVAAALWIPFNLQII
jgi:hypothetical protein